MPKSIAYWERELELALLTHEQLKLAKGLFTEGFLGHITAGDSSLFQPKAWLRVGGPDGRWVRKSRRDYQLELVYYELRKRQVQGYRRIVHLSEKVQARVAYCHERIETLRKRTVWDHLRENVRDITKERAGTGVSG